MWGGKHPARSFAKSSRRHTKSFIGVDSTAVRGCEKVPVTSDKQQLEKEIKKYSSKPY